MDIRINISIYLMFDTVSTGKSSGSAQVTVSEEIRSNRDCYITILIFDLTNHPHYAPVYTHLYGNRFLDMSV